LKYLLILGIDYKSKNITINSKSIKLKIWDTAGQERFRNITQQYYKNADGILLVFDVSDRSSFEKVRDWIKQIQAYTQKDQIGVVLVGNKCDVENREVKTEEGEALASEYNLKYFETSALNNSNIEETFQHLAQEIIRVKDVKESGGVPVNQNNNISLENKDKEKAPGKEKKCC
jgi:small GTP-binding protein